MPELLSLKETVEKYGLMAKKSLGQNFLLDTNITDKIIRSSLEMQKKKDFRDDVVYEVGPGPGGLTRSILKANPKKLIVIEKDERCVQIMQDIKTVVGDKLDIVEGDALLYDYNKDANISKNIISNLPYNISVPLLIYWLKNMRSFSSLTLMFQKEVAERIMAEPNNKEYGRISVLSQLVCRIDKLFLLNPSCFVPAPKIWSAVLLFRPLAEIPSVEMLNKLEKITEMAFNQRRKMIRQSLKKIKNLEKVCKDIGVDMTFRAENIHPHQYLKLAELCEV